jgi:outer membrane lipoprotein SlyB
MAGKVMDQDLSDTLKDNTTGSGILNSGLVMRLFTNNITPTNANVIGDFTEATFAGYSSQTLGAWSAPSVTAHVGKVSGAALTFTITAGSQTVYGYYVTDAGNTKLYFAERDPNAPVALAATGPQTYTITPTYQRQSA